MVDQIENWRIKTFTGDVEKLLQQEGSRLAPHMRNLTFQGKNAEVVKQIGEAVITELTTRHADTVITEVPKDKRWLQPRHWGTAELVDDEDILEQLGDPKSELAIAMRDGMGRKQDDIIIAAAFGTNFTGEEGTTSVTAAADGVLVVDSGGSFKMTIDKLKTTMKNFMAAEVDLNREQLFVAITAEQHDSLLKETQAINLDYTTNPVLVSGRISSFMGFNFVHTELLPLNGGGDRRCLAWAKSGLVLGSWRGFMGNVSRRPDKWENWQISLKATFNCTRTQGKKVQEIVCAE